MGLQKQPVTINFQKGLDTKPDPNQLATGSFVSLVNSVFDKIGQMTKRNGNAPITSLPAPASYISTFNNNLTSVGSTLQSYSQGSNTWVNNGPIQPLKMSVTPLIRNSVNQSQADSAISTNGLICTVYTESNGSATSYKYAVADATTGQSVIAPTALAADATYGFPKVYFLGSVFVILYVNNPGGYNLKMLTINSADLIVGSVQTITTSITPSTSINFSASLYNNSLYIAWNGAAASGVKACYITSTLSISSTIILDASHVATVMSVTSDTNAGVIWVSYYDSVSALGYTLAVSPALASVLAPTQIIPSGAIVNITSAAQNGVNTVFYETTNAYTYDGAVPSNFISLKTITQAGAVTGPVIVVRSLGLASSAFIISGSIYFLGAYSSPYQPTYFLIKGTSTAANPIVIAKLAYSNGGGYCVNGLPTVTVSGTTARFPYLIKDLVTAVNKNTNVPTGSQVKGVYSQTGINIATINLTTTGLCTAEIGSNLHFTGGFLWSYDGITPTEHNFFLYPDSVESSSQPTTGGFLTAQIYFYQVMYKWSDNQGNTFRSAPSIPIKVDISASGTATNSVILNVPTLRLTYKATSPVVVEVYRWSVGQQTYYQSTSLTAPVLNDPTIDFVTITDTLSDASILGNNLIYTTGGVLADVDAPSLNAITLFDTRLWGIAAEDPNILWQSKIVIPATPVEFSAELTTYVAPNISEKQSTGPMKCLYPMDDKLIIFKDFSLFYINGTGPDITGANSQYSEPTFIASPVGCANQNSIVLIPEGLMFQSKNGIWLLRRNLQVTYIGKEVEAFNSATVLSVVSIPNSNRVQFMLDSGVTLMYDHFMGQWSSFSGMPGISSVVYNGLHTYISAPITVTPPTGQPYTVPSKVYQETPGLYLDGSKPVQMSFTTGWISMAGLQGYKRAYWMVFLGNYISPHTFTVGIAYDYNPAVVQMPQILPNNSTGSWGGNDTWGTDNNISLPNDNYWGGSSSVEQWQVNFQQQLCQSIQITFNEIFDPTQNLPAGAGLTLSAMEIVVGLKKSYPLNISAANTTG